MKPSEEVARRRKRIRLRSLLSIASFAVLSSTYGVDGVSFSSYSTVLSGYGAYTVPWCGDFDGDGDNDCIIGTATSDVGYFENSGTASSYDFPSGSSPTTSNFLNFATSDGITYSSPWCGDMDNDGKAGRLCLCQHPTSEIDRPRHDTRFARSTQVISTAS